MLCSFLIAKGYYEFPVITEKQEGCQQENIDY